MSRILKPKGILITSTDYWEKPVDTGGIKPFGLPFEVFTKKEILALFNSGKKYHLELNGELDLACKEKAVKWKEYDLDYTFISFTMVKMET